MEDTKSPEALKRQGIKALGWGVAGSLIKVLLAIGVQATLARLLGPSEFGLFAIGLVMLGIASFFSDVGLATRLVQRETLEPGDVAFVLAWNTLLSGAIALAVLLGAELIAEGFKKPAAVDVIRVLALVLMVNAFTSISVALLRRSLNYKTIQIGEIFGYIVGFAGVGIGLALSPWSRFALVGAFVSQAAVTALYLYFQTRHTLRMTFKNADSSSFAGFGMAILATNLVNWYVSSVDKIFIGRAHPEATLGLYSTVQNLTGSPANVLYPQLQSIVFSTTARLQGDYDALGRTYLSLLATVLAVIIPLFAGLAVIADVLAVFVYGSGWEAARGLAAPMALMAPCILVWGISTPLLWNSERKMTEIKVQAVFAVAITACLYVAARQSIDVVAWTVCAMFYARIVAIAVAASRRLGITMADLGRVCLQAAVPVAVVVGVMTVWRMAALGAALPPTVTVGVGLPLIVVSAAVVFLLRPALLPPSVRDTIGGFAARVPGPMQFLMRRISG